MQQLHKKFTTDQVKQFIQRYLNKEIERRYLQSILGLRIWKHHILLDMRKIKNTDLKGVHF